VARRRKKNGSRLLRTEENVVALNNSPLLIEPLILMAQNGFFANAKVPRFWPLSIDGNAS
jgi:hypothetical protein